MTGPQDAQPSARGFYRTYRIESARGNKIRKRRAKAASWVGWRATARRTLPRPRPPPARLRPRTSACRPLPGPSPPPGIRRAAPPGLTARGQARRVEREQRGRTAGMPTLEAEIRLKWRPQVQGPAEPRGRLHSPLLGPLGPPTPRTPAGAPALP